MKKWEINIEGEEEAIFKITKKKRQRNLRQRKSHSEIEVGLGRLIYKDQERRKFIEDFEESILKEDEEEREVKRYRRSKIEVEDGWDSNRTK